MVSQRYMSVEICKIENISKIYPGVRALDDVSMENQKRRNSRDHGKNGAGKSTLVNILAGLNIIYLGENHHQRRGNTTKLQSHISQRSFRCSWCHRIHPSYRNAASLKTFSVVI